MPENREVVEKYYLLFLGKVLKPGESLYYYVGIPVYVRKEIYMGLKEVSMYLGLSCHGRVHSGRHECVRRKRAISK